MGEHGQDTFNKDDFRETVVCPKCGFESAADSFSCLHCDHILSGADVVACSKCGFENTTDLVECLNCGSTLKEADAPDATCGESVEVFSTWDPLRADMVSAHLKASGVECDVVDAGTVISVPTLTLGLAPETNTVPLFIVVPADQASRAEAALEQMNLDDDLPTSGSVPVESDELLCPACETPYKQEDYDPRALRIYCCACREELPRHRSRRFQGRDTG